MFEPVYKPSFVIDSHSSSFIIADKVTRSTLPSNNADYILGFT